MLKKILALAAMMYAAVSFAAVDVNKATAAELDAIKGIGPGISTKIIDERKKGTFRDWNDFIERVKGVGEVNASKFSAEGMTVNGSSFKGTTAASAVKKEEKKAEVKPATAAIAAAPTAKEEKGPKANAKAKKEAGEKAKAEEKAKQTEETKAKTEAAKPTTSATKK